MGAFYLTLLAVLLSGVGARDQITIAALTRRQGPRLGVLVIGLVLAAATCALATFAAREVLTILPLPARPVLAAITLGLAGLESLVLSPRADPREPTHSLGALFFVLAFHQLTDAARFTLFGFAVGSGSPLAAGLGGGLAGLLLAGVGWFLPDLVLAPAIRVARRLIGALLLVMAIAMFLGARGLL